MSKAINIHIQIVVNTGFVNEGEFHYNLGDHKAGRSIAAIAKDMWKGTWDTLCSKHTFGNAELIITDVETGEVLHNSNKELNAFASACMYKGFKPAPIYSDEEMRG